MTQNEIIEMARQAGANVYNGGPHFSWKELEAFAKLVAAKEREACAKVSDEYVGQDLEHNFSALISHNIRARGEA